LSFRQKFTFFFLKTLTGQKNVMQFHANDMSLRVPSIVRAE